jgi:hypothetical protein
VIFLWCDGYPTLYEQCRHNARWVPSICIPWFVRWVNTALPPDVALYVDTMGTLAVAAMCDADLRRHSRCQYFMTHFSSELVIQTLQFMEVLWRTYYVLASRLGVDSSRLGGLVVSMLASGPKACGFEPGQGDCFLRVVKIRSTRSSRLVSKAGRSHVVRFYSMLNNSWSPTGMNRLNFHFFAHLRLLQSALVVKLGVSPSRSRLLTSSHSLSPGDSTVGPRP